MFRLHIGFCVLVASLSMADGAVRVNAHNRARSVMAKRELDLSRRTIEDNEIILEELLELKDSETMSIKREGKTTLGTKLDKMQEYYKGLPVFSGQVTVESDAEGALTGDVTGMFFQQIEDDIPELPPGNSNGRCLDVAIEYEGDEQYLELITDVSVDMMIYVDDDDVAHAACLVEYLIESDDIQKRPSVIIDVSSGNVLLEWNSINTFNCGKRTYKSYGGNEKYGKIKYGDKPYCLRIEPVGDTCYLENQYVKVVDMNFSSLPQTETASFRCKDGYDDEVNGGYSPIVDAYFFGTMVAKMFEDWFSSTPLKDKLVLRVHYSTSFENAFWNGRFCTFGDGGNMMYPFTVMDIVGHEIGHGVTEQGSGLIYSGEAGGLNEAFSDILGEATEAYITSNADLLIGHEVMKDRDFMRSMEEPTSDNMSISHVDQMEAWMDPHFSSGVYNRVFFVVVKQKNMAVQDAVRVFLHANRMYWCETSTFASAACDTLKAAYDLGYDITPFARAFDDVGITPCNVSTHIVSLRLNRTLTDITVSNTIRPIFQINVPRSAMNMTIESESTVGDVHISLRNGTYDLEDWDEDQEGLIAEADNVMTFVPDGGLYYIQLSAETDAEYTDVTLFFFGDWISRY
ncbi:hypothetical protein ScPMuIL_014788 [Solemya velum]